MTGAISLDCLLYGDARTCQGARICGPRFQEKMRLGDMLRVSRIQELYRELDQVEAAIRPYMTLRPPDSPTELTAEQLEKYAGLNKRRGEILTELARLGGGTV